jgi:hypothetical protein
MRPSFLTSIGLGLCKALPDLSDYPDKLLVRKLLHVPLCRSFLTPLRQQRNYDPQILERMFSPPRNQQLLTRRGIR